MEHGHTNIADIVVLDLADFIAETRHVREVYHEHGADRAHECISRELAKIIGEHRTRAARVLDGTVITWIQWVCVFDQPRVPIRGESFEELCRAANAYTVQRLLGEAHALLCADITLESLHWDATSELLFAQV